jgi:hypothetical protein
MTRWYFTRGFLGLAICLSTGGAGGFTVFGIGVAASGSIGGHVRDQGGRPLPGVSVIAIPRRGGTASSTFTDREGAYGLELPDDTYRVDFRIPGFDLARQNHVLVRPDAQTLVDATLQASVICECLSGGLPTVPQRLEGRVVDEAGRPLPHARVDVVTSTRSETTYTDSEGRFLVRAPVEGAWPISASDSGFASARRQVSKATVGPVVLRLRFDGTERPPDQERFSLGCLCPEYLSGF